MKEPQINPQNLALSAPERKRELANDLRWHRRFILAVTLRHPTLRHAEGAEQHVPDRQVAVIIGVHVALVMDGNGRWAKQRGLPRTEGHKAGEYALFDVNRSAVAMGFLKDNYDERLTALLATAPGPAASIVGRAADRWAALFPVIATCTQQGRDLFPFLRDALSAMLHGQSSPTLQPNTS